MAKSAIIIALFISFIIFSNAISPDAYDIPGFFTFGDSTMDPGNNNNLNTEIKAISLPYGEDFPTHAPTGRFSNGKLVADFLVATLNLSDAHPAYVGHVVSANDIGVSFASAGSGLDDSTAKPVQVTTMSDQIQQFVENIGKLKALKGDAATQDFIKKSIFIISIGTNDMMFNIL
ncbi:hypothetical protein LUZ60_005935 [Juncus effusus]|nr:hypothetical protein LUZ60_005935 [Juncus effusus]